jgi:hypothetical protein
MSEQKRTVSVEARVIAAHREMAKDPTGDPIEAFSTSARVAYQRERRMAIGDRRHGSKD